MPKKQEPQPRMILVDKWKSAHRGRDNKWWYHVWTSTLPADQAFYHDTGRFFVLAPENIIFTPFILVIPVQAVTSITSQLEWVANV